MTQKLISRKVMEESAAKYGFSPAPKDHPIFSEGPSITFSSRTPKQSPQKGTGSPRKGSATQKKK